MTTETAESSIYTWAPRWTCFHCGDSFTDENEAASHFGLSLDDIPSCILMLTNGEKAIVEINRKLRSDNIQLESQLDQKSYELFLERNNWLSFGKAKSLNEARSNYESVEGRALASEELLGLLPSWYVDMLRKYSEFRWRRQQKARQKFMEQVKAVKEA